MLMSFLVKLDHISTCSLFNEHVVLIPKFKILCHISSVLDMEGYQNKVISIFFIICKLHLGGY